MAEPHSTTLELHRAQSGHDLWAAVEAAQYAHVVEHDEPRADVEANRMRELIGFFADCAEEWEGKSSSDQTVALEQLGNRLAALAELDLYVYWTVTQGRFDTAEGEAVDLPVAVLTIARDGQPSITVSLPGTLESD